MKRPVGPVTMRKYEAMARTLFQLLDDATGGALKPPTPQICMALFIFSFDGAELTYISNSRREDMVRMLAEFIAANQPQLTWDEQHG